MLSAMVLSSSARSNQYAASSIGRLCVGEYVSVGAGLLVIARAADKELSFCAPATLKSDCALTNGKPQVSESLSFVVA